jgi:hypothetical protein
MNARLGLRRLVFLVVTSGVLTLALPYAAAPQSLAPDDVVLWTAATSPGDVRGDWIREVDGTAAGGVVLRNPDRGRARVSPALASPVNYFEMRFSATRATAYHLWVRMRAESDGNQNDSVHVQFSDSVDSLGQSIIRIGTTDTAEVILQNGSGGEAAQGWGWTDNGWGTVGTPIYFAADGPHVIRIQQREDGAAIDQIVLSPVTFAVSPPSASRPDTTILPQTSGVGPTVSSDTSIIHVASAAADRVYGAWQAIADTTAAGSQALRNPDAGAARIAPALSSPVSYFEATFTADAGRPYHVWVRMRAEGNSTSNDSVHLQFDDSLTTASSPPARIGTTSSLQVVLQDGPNGSAPHAWGWTDNGWDALGAHVYFAATGTHTIRVQQREDGAVIDQIVISPDTFLTTPPGQRLDDATILQESATATATPSNLPPTVTLTAPANGSSYTAPATVTLTAAASDPENRLAKVDFYSGSTLLASDTTAPFSFPWSSVAAGTYQLRAVATDAGGASASSAIATVTVSAPPPTTLTTPTTRRVAFTASVDHATVTEYLLEVFPSTANPATATAIASSDLGKPTPGSDNEIIVDRTTFLNNLSPGSYLITVASVGSGGSSRSVPVAFTR